MKIGLVRHFKVDIPFAKRRTSEEYRAWGYAYDEADVIPNPVNLKGIDWHKCYASDLKRAVITAKAIYPGKIIETSALREVRNSPVFKSKKPKSHLYLSATGRIAWFLSHKSQEEGRRATLKRINAFLDQLDLEGDENILVVCHGFFMYSFQKVLRARGFKGKSFLKPKNGELHVFEKL